MKNNFTLVKTLLLFICMGFFSAITAQVQFNYVASQPLAESGQTDFVIDVRVSDFDDVLSSQFVISWDPEVLQIDSVLNLNSNLPGFNNTVFALPSQTYDMTLGRVNFSWISQTLSGITLPANSLLFKMKFTVVGDPCDITTIASLETANFPTEIMNSAFVNLGIVEPQTTIEVAGQGCNNFLTNLSCNNLVNVSLSPWSGEAVLTPDMILEGGPYNYTNMIVSPALLTCDDIGKEVTVTVVDNTTGNSCWGIMKAEDKTPPVAIAETKVIVQLTQPSAGGDPTARLFAESVDVGSYDNCTDITFSPQFWDFDCSDVGIQDVVMSVTDAYGNWNSVITTVQVVDPAGFCDGFVETLACNDLVNMSLSNNPTGTELSPDAVLEGGPYDLSVITVSPSVVTCDDIGAPINYTVTNNDNGNSCWGQIIVEDKQPPNAISRQIVTVALTASSQGGPLTAKLFVESVDNGSFDLCTDVTLSPEFWEFDCSDIGQQNITMIVTDGYGNTNQVFTTVIVEAPNLPTNSVNCPSDIVVNCSADITNADYIEDVLGSASTDLGCNLPFVDVFGFDANNDGDQDDMHTINGEMISEGFSPCQLGTVIRTWSAFGTTEATCVQLIGIKPPTETFNGLTMVDWPYSKNDIINLGNNDSGASCSSGCPAISTNDIDLVYDSNGVLTGCTLTTDCANALCEEPLFNASNCSLIGFSTEETVFNLPNGDLRIVKVHTVIDWCAYDPDSSSQDGLWEYTVDATITDGGNNVTFSAADISGGKGQQICMPFRVNNFKDIESFQGSISWDESVASFATVTSFGLPGMNNSSFGLFDTDNGNLSYLWIDQTGTSPVTLSNGSTMFSICFDIIGDEGESTSVTFENSPTAIEVSSNFLNLPFITNDGSIEVTDGSCSGDVISPTPYCISLSTALMVNGQVELWAIDFNAGSFDNCTPSNNLRYTFTDVNPSNDPNFSGTSSRKIYTAADINFVTSKTITEKINVWDENGNSDFCLVSLTLINNSGNGGVGDVTFEFDEVSVDAGGTKCVPLKVKNFTNVETFQGSIVWDHSVAKFTDLTGFNLPGLSASTFNTANAENGNMSFLWFDNTGTTPANLPDGSTLFEVCFEAIGAQGETSNVTVSNTPLVVQVTKAGSQESVDVNLISGKFSILNSNCVLDESQIIWPLDVITVNVPNVTSATASDILSPVNLSGVLGLEFSDVFPTYNIDPECVSSVASSNSDSVIEVNGGTGVKIVREWVVLDWSSGNIFEFTQIVQNYLDGFGICDTLPNSAPFGDCDSGHTDDDDVEWPDDLAIADHRITPSELVTTSGVDPNDAKPIFYNAPDVYEATYADSVGGLSPTNLNIKRIWSVTRSDFAGKTWKYIQCIDVDLTDFGNLVTVSTINGRPLSSVILNATDMTNEEGFAYVEDEVNPSRSDMLRNGLNVKDVIMMQAGILGKLSLTEDQYEAADFNMDGLLTVNDIIEIKRLLLGINSDVQTEWQFYDALTEIESGLEPKGHYVAFKRGDVDDSADIGFGEPVYMTENLIFEDKLLNAGEFYSVPLYIGSDMKALGTELNLTFNDDKVSITGVNSDQVFGSVSYNIIGDDRLAMITENVNIEAENLDSETPLLTIEILAKENGTLKEVFGVSEIDESFVLDADYNLIKIEELVEGGIILDNENLDNSLAIDVYPNPVVDYLIVDDYNAFTGKNIQFELFDLAGQRILSVQNPNSVNVSQLTSGMYIYKVSVDGRFTSGRIVKE